MSYEVVFSSTARCDLKKLPRPDASRILDAIDALATEPRPLKSRKLTGQRNAWRIRVGQFRVIYEIQDSVLTVTVLRAAHRREVYQKL